MAARILVIEDDRALRQVLVSALESGGYQVEQAADGAAGVQAVRTKAFEVVLLDIGLPFVDGWQVLSTLEGRRIPSVIVISARGDQADKVRALDMGADDYLAKPFGSDELLARLRAVLRRAQPPAQVPLVVHQGAVTIDLSSHSVLKGGLEVRLSPTEYLLVAELARHAHEVMDYRTLLHRVWGPVYGDERHYLRVFIQRLRHKLEEDPTHPQVIQTVAGRGYRFGPAIER
ncbi:MAG TPA: response regulator transcription factor [Candidatus Dormibacteraeota bacterium]|jgi:two-component system KDP operon response regulator KdpE|nr:response regulator transcription factor [Candidatus Dormibacteraeota bacterium]